MSRILNFHAVKAYNGWDFNLRQYNIRPEESLVFQYADAGDVTGLQGLFDKHEASPWDCDENGWTPLHVRSTCDSIITAI